MGHRLFAVLFAVYSMGVLTPSALAEGDPVRSSLEGIRTHDRGQVFQGDRISHEFALRVPEGQTLRIKEARPT